MTMMSVLSVELKPECVVRYESLLLPFAQQAREKHEKFNWTAYQTLVGAQSAIRYVSNVDSFASLESRGSVPELAARVLGPAEAQRLAQEVGACVAAQSLTLSIDRPDLSYLRGTLAPADIRFASVSRIRVRPGAREAFEELARKLAEAIPKLDDPAQLLTQQAIVGDMTSYTLVRPLRELGDLDKQRTPEQLLIQAFGAGEGGLVFRNGGDAITSLEREIVARRDDLSNPPA
jgi:hypothetical protein